MAYKNKEDQKEYRKRWLNSQNRPKSSCHPEKPHRARGMCDSCYDLWLYANSEKYRKSRLDGAKKWKGNNEVKVKILAQKSKLIYHYGITIEDYNRMLAEQKGVCKICEGDNNGKRLHVDHCHKSGIIRGLLCLKCNGSLSWVEEVISKKHTQWFSKALKYLRNGK